MKRTFESALRLDRCLPKKTHSCSPHTSAAQPKPLAISPWSSWTVERIEIRQSNTASGRPMRLSVVKRLRHQAIRSFLSLLASTMACGAATAIDLKDLITDRTAVERVYYEHRLGTRPPFERTLPAAEIERLVKSDLRKETILAKIYHVEITDPQIETEIHRIDTETRAPEMLAEIKAALGNDPARFARAVARPIAVEQELRRRFENDDRWHAAQCRQVEAARRKILARRREDSWEKIIQTLKEADAGAVEETTWQLGARPVADKAPNASALFALRMPVKARSGKYSLDATARFAPPLAPVERADEPSDKRRFEDLSPELRGVLRVQLQKTGDVSGVIETPNGFLFFVARGRTENTLGAAALSVPKLSFEQWLSEQKESTTSGKAGGFPFQ